jgi:hypothetical protein
VLVLADSTSTALGVLSLVSLAAGYAVLWALWHFVFRAKRHRQVDAGDSEDVARRR